MICKSCGSTTARVRILAGKERCTVCAGFSEAGGVRIDGILSRQRTRDQGVKYEGDTINPWKYDQASKGFVPNDDFIKMHAENAHNFFTPKDVAKSHPKLAKRISQGFEDKTPVEGIGETTQAFKEVIKQA